MTRPAHLCDLDVGTLREMTPTPDEQARALLAAWEDQREEEEETP